MDTAPEAAGLKRGRGRERSSKKQHRRAPMVGAGGNDSLRRRGLPPWGTRVRYLSPPLPLYIFTHSVTSSLYSGGVGPATSTLCLLCASTHATAMPTPRGPQEPVYPTVSDMRTRMAAAAVACRPCRRGGGLDILSAQMPHASLFQDPNEASSASRGKLQHISTS